MDVVPVEEPEAAESLMADQLGWAWRPVTVMALEGTRLVGEGAVTVIATLALQAAPPAAVAVTLTVCAPSAAGTCTFSELPLETTEAPVSSARPIAVMVCDE